MLAQKKKKSVAMVCGSLFCLFLFFLSLDADSTGLEKDLIRSLMEEKNIGILQEVVDNISGSIDKIILNTELDDEGLDSILRYGIDYCSPHRGNGWYYCMYEKNREALEKNIDLDYPDTCTHIMKEYPYREWRTISGVTRNFIEDCVEKRLKVAVFFAKRTNFQIPIDFITNKFRRWIILNGIFEKAAKFVK